MGFEPKTFRSTVQRTNHYATLADSLNFYHFIPPLPCNEAFCDAREHRFYEICDQNWISHLFTAVFWLSPTCAVLLFVSVFQAVDVTIYVLLYCIFFCPFDCTVECTWPGSFPFAVVFIYFFWGDGGGWGGGGVLAWLPSVYCFVYVLFEG